MRNRYSTQKNNKKNRRRGNIKTRSIQRGGLVDFVPMVASAAAMGADTLLRSATTAGSDLWQSTSQPRQSASQPPQENNDSSVGIDLNNMKESLLSQLLNIVPVNEGEDFTPEQRAEVVDYIKSSDYIKELRRSYHKPTDLQKGMQDIFDGIKAKILEYPDKWQASRLEKKNNLVANDLLQSSLDSFSSAVKEGKQMSIDKLGQLWGVVNSAKDCMGGATQSGTSESAGGETGESEDGKDEKPVENTPDQVAEKKSEDQPQQPQPQQSQSENKSSGLKSKASELAQSVGSKFSSMFETRQKGGKVNVHEHPRKYIKEIKDNRKKLYEKEMEIIRSIRNFNNSHTRTHNHLHNSNKYHTRKFRRAIMK
jgi:hypothetical protein